MAEVALRRASRAEKDTFTGHFQDYLAELSRLNGARPNRKGRYEYSYYESYWRGDPTRTAFFIECDGRPAGLLLLPEHESPQRVESLQVAEICVFPPYRRRQVGKQAMWIAAHMAEERGVPLTWSAYMNNGPANALYASVCSEFGAGEGAWTTSRTRGIDLSGLARFYYQMAPPCAVRDKNV